MKKLVTSLAALTGKQIVVASISQTGCKAGRHEFTDFQERRFFLLKDRRYINEHIRANCDFRV